MPSDYQKVGTYLKDLYLRIVHWQSVSLSTSLYPWLRPLSLEDNTGHAGTLGTCLPFSNFLINVFIRRREKVHYSSLSICQLAVSFLLSSLFSFFGMFGNQEYVSFHVAADKAFS